MSEWCTVCNAEGGFEEFDEDYDEMVWEQCNECHGTGYIDEDCEACLGYGMTLQGDDCEICEGKGIV